MSIVMCYGCHDLHGSIDEMHIMPDGRLLCDECYKREISGYELRERICPKCGGKGTDRYGDECDRCDGTGWVH